MRRSGGGWEDLLTECKQDSQAEGGVPLNNNFNLFCMVLTAYSGLIIIALLVSLRAGADAHLDFMHLWKLKAIIHKEQRYFAAAVTGQYLQAVWSSAGHLKDVLIPIFILLTSQPTAHCKTMVVCQRGA
jgi:hypothetical protein